MILRRNMVEHVKQHMRLLEQDEPAEIFFVALARAIE